MTIMWWNPTHDHNVNCFSMRSKLGMLSMSMNGGHSLLELKPLTEGTAAQDGVDSHTHTHEQKQQAKKSGTLLPGATS